MDYLFAAPTVPSLPIRDDERRFPVRRIFCIGRNYADHAKEMGASIDRGRPVFFNKPTDALVSDGGDVPYPSATALLHHEVEMVVALHSGGRNVDVADAGRLVFGHAVGLDLTRRDLQADMKARRWPWDVAKGMDHGAPVSAICPLAAGAPTQDTYLSLEINGELRQRAQLRSMLWAVPEIIVELSRLFELAAGDLIFTGTPAGVGVLEPGDRYVARLGELVTLRGRIC